MDGYAGTILYVNLTNREVRKEALPEAWTRDFLGGYGIGARVLLEKMPGGADPLGPENILGILAGPVTGTRAFFGGRYTIVHKSPVTSGWNDANSGGHLGPELKRAGYDAVFIEGKSDTPVYLWIHNEKVEIRSAVHLAGIDCKEILPMLQEEVQESSAKVMAIGKPGEEQALLACPINDGHRATGRGGGGAVMGSKNLKAVVVRGTGSVSVADDETLKTLNQQIAEAIRTTPGAQRFSEYGTGAGTAASALNGDSPVKNWAGAGHIDFDAQEAERLTSAALDRFKTRQYRCAACPMGCGAEYAVNEGPWPVGETERPEYETAAAFGSTLLCSDEFALMKCNELCNRAGLDTISAGMTIAWATEAYNEGVLTKEELDGIDLTWGNGEAIVQIMKKMAAMEGVGKILANGSAWAARHFGKGEQFLQTASGIELPMHDPRYAPGLGRTYKVDPTPGRHVKGGRGLIQMSGAEDDTKYDYTDTGDDDAVKTALMEVLNAAGFCMFLLYAGAPGIQFPMLEAVTGTARDQDELIRLGKRIYALRHQFNLREGITPGDMPISARAIGHPPLNEGPLEGVEVDNDRLIDNFYRAMGMDPKTGKLKEETRRELGGLEFAGSSDS